jgi:hypothetical protein
MTNATMTAPTRRASTSHGHQDDEDPLAAADGDAADAVGGGGVEVTVVVCVCVLVFVAVEVDVEVEVDVSVEVCVLVEVSVLVEVVCVDEDVRVARLRDGLGVGPSGGLAVSERLGTAIVREALGRLLPPAQEPISKTSIEKATTLYPTATQAWM